MLAFKQELLILRSSVYSVLFFLPEWGSFFSNKTSNTYGAQGLFCLGCDGKLKDQLKNYLN